VKQWVARHYFVFQASLFAIFWPAGVWLASYWTGIQLGVVEHLHTFQVARQLP